MASNIVYFPKIDFDYDILREIANSPKNPSTELLRHHRKVDDYPYLVEIRKRYPFLSDIINVHRMVVDTPIHVDTGRNCTLNIPLMNTETSETITYEGEIFETAFASNSNYNKVISGNLTEIHRFTLDRPTLFNTTLPHAVNINNQVRLTLGWTIPRPITFEEAILLFNEYEQDLQ